MKIGVLGGGQLGRMLALDGIPLGMAFRFLEPGDDPPAATLGQIVSGAHDDPLAWHEFVEGLDVVTYEFENVSLEAVEYLSTKAPVHPGAAALAMAQNRLVEKSGFQSLGIETARFAPVSGQDDVEPALALVGLPAVLKTCRMGYDGKGQVVVRSLNEVRAAVDVLGSDLIMEGFVEFDRELSIVAVGGTHGERRYYPLAENHHNQGVLRVSYAPAPGAEALQAKAEAIAEKVMDHLGYVGVLAIELFQVGQRLLANEVAPRVHNSGHWTQDGAVTSQFENHIRAITGLPLGDTEALGPSVMVNLIGDVPPMTELAGLPGAHVHLYDKSPRPGRKLGHVNLFGGDWNEVLERRDALSRIIGTDNPLPGPASAK